MNNYVYIIPLILMSIVIVWLVIVLFKAKKPNTKNKLTEIKDFVLLKDGSDILSILDQRIEDNLNTYTIYNIEFREVIFISSEIQERMNIVILGNVLNSLSDDYINILKLLYKDYEDEIKKRVELRVMSYVIEKNGNYKE